MAVRNLPPNQKGTVAPATSPPRADAAGVGGRGPRSYGVQKAPVDPVAADVESGMDISDDEAPLSPEKSLLSRSKSDPSKQLPVTRAPQPHLSPLADEEYFERLQQQLESASVPASAGPAPTTHTSHSYSAPLMAYSMPIRTPLEQRAYHYSTPQHRGHSPHLGVSPPFAAHSPSPFGGSSLHHHYTAQPPMMQYGSSPVYGQNARAPTPDTLGMNNLYMLANASAQHVGYGEADEEKTALTKSASAPLERQRPMGFGPMGIHGGSPFGYNNSSNNHGQDPGNSTTDGSDSRSGSVWRPF